MHEKTPRTAMQPVDRASRLPRRRPHRSAAALAVRARRIALSFMVPLATLVGCSPNLGHSVQVLAIPTPELSAAYRSTPWGGRIIAVEPPSILPERPLGATIDGRFVPLEGALDSAVNLALRKRLRLAGATLRRDAPVTVQSRVTLWEMEVYPGFPRTSVVARASVALEALLPSGEVAYRGTYTGESTQAGPNIRSSLIEGTLESAMGHALDEIALDERLVNAVDGSRAER